MCGVRPISASPLALYVCQWQYSLYPTIVSECWVFYAVPTARVIFTAKTSFDIFSLS